MYWILGALARAIWGGFEPFKPYFTLNKIIKLIALYIFAFLCGFFVNFGNAYDLDMAVFGIACLLLAVSLAHPLGHGAAQAMGKPNPKNGDLPLHLCIAIFLGNYGIAMMLVGMAYNIIFHAQSGTIYAAMGLLCWVPHWAAQYVINPLWDKFGLKWKPTGQGYMFDGVTRFGELGLGAIMFGGLALL